MISFKMKDEKILRELQIRPAEQSKESLRTLLPKFE